MKSFLKFILSHHYENEYYRCYKIGNIHFCARCLGVYPILLLFLILQFYIEPNLITEAIIIFFFPIPALTDWIFYMLFNKRGYNWVRTTTGILFGISIGRLIYLHIKNPLSFVTIGAFAFYTLLVGIIFMIRFLNKE